jgi:hypothetical protein
VEANEDTLENETLAVSWRWEEKERAVKIDCGLESCFVALSKVAKAD